MPSKPWQKLLNEASQELPAKGFNVIIETSELTIPVGVQGVVQPQMKANGRTFQVTASNDVLEEVAITPSRFSFSVTRYSRWKQFCERLRSILYGYLGQALALERLTVLQLDYWDRFVFDGDVSELNYTDLLNPNSFFVPCFALSQKELWHSHVGYFADMQGPNKRLINLNVDALDLTEARVAGQKRTAPKLRSVGIYTMAQERIVPELSPDGTEFLQDSLQALHDELKRVLGDVIATSVAERISLNFGSGGEQK